jgi:DNA-binding HxlR family transcriptional regulator
MSGMKQTDPHLEEVNQNITPKTPDGCEECLVFNELRQAGLSSTVLSDRLLELERKDLISEKIYPEIPPKVEYRITPQARELESILGELGKWASRWKSPQLQKTKLQ